MKNNIDQKQKKLKKKLKYIFFIKLKKELSLTKASEVEKFNDLFDTIIKPSEKSGQKNSQ